MENDELKHQTVPISDISHLNITFNLCRCGKDTLDGREKSNYSASACFTVCYVQTGNARLEVDDLMFFVSASQGFFVFPDQHFTIHNVKDTRMQLIWIQFTGYKVELYLSRSGIDRNQPVFQDQTGEKGECIEKIFEQSHQLPNRYCRMMATMYTLFTSLIDTSPYRQPNIYRNPVNENLHKAVSFITENFESEITVEEIADAVGISRKSLYMLFNSVFGLSPKRFLIYFRIEKACQRLKSKDLSVGEIAKSVGYSNQFYFAKEFKRLLGMTPSEYRNSGNLKELSSFQFFSPTLQNDGERLSMHEFMKMWEKLETK